MKMVRLAVIVAVLMAALAVFAQEATLGLSPEDYALFSTANSTAVNSFAFDYSGHVVVDGLDTFAVNGTVNGNGAVDRQARVLDVSLNGSVRFGTV